MNNRLTHGPFSSNPLFGRYNKTHGIIAIEEEESDISSSEEEPLDKHIEAAREALSISLNHLLSPAAIESEWEALELRRAAHTTAATFKLGQPTGIASSIITRIQSDNAYTEEASNGIDGFSPWTGGRSISALHRIQRIGQSVPILAAQANILDVLSVATHVEQCKSMIHLYQWLGTDSRSLVSTLVTAWVSDQAMFRVEHSPFVGVMQHIDTPPKCWEVKDSPNFDVAER